MRQFIGPFEVETGRKPNGAKLLATAILLFKVDVVDYGSVPQKQTGDLKAIRRGSLIYFGTQFRVWQGSYQTESSCLKNLTSQRELSR
jgi:hypothetical protein